jgi:DNA repair protein RadC
MEDPQVRLGIFNAHRRCKVTVSFPVRGLSSLTDHELVARLLGPKRGPALAVALMDKGLSWAANAQPEAIVALGFTPREAELVAVALEMCRRTAPAPATMAPVVTPASAAPWFQPMLESLPVEEFHALYLDRRMRPIRYVKHTRGSDAYTVVDCGAVFRTAVELSAVAVVVGHNHPSGDPSPSPEDVAVTRKLAAGLATLGVRLNDHLVIGHGRWVSLAERGCL